MSASRSRSRSTGKKRFVRGLRGWGDDKDTKDQSKVTTRLSDDGKEIKKPNSREDSQASKPPDADKKPSRDEASSGAFSGSWDAALAAADGSDDRSPSKNELRSRSRDAKQSNPKKDQPKVAEPSPSPQIKQARTMRGRDLIEPAWKKRMRESSGLSQPKEADQSSKSASSTQGWNPKKATSDNPEDVAKKSDGVLDGSKLDEFLKTAPSANGTAKQPKAQGPKAEGMAGLSSARARAAAFNPSLPKPLPVGHSNLPKALPVGAQLAVPPGPQAQIAGTPPLRATHLRLPCPDKVTFTIAVPVKLAATDDTTLADIRQMLKDKPGLKIDGSFRFSKRPGEDLVESLKLSDLQPHRGAFGIRLTDEIHHLVEKLATRLKTPLKSPSNTVGAGLGGMMSPGMAFNQPDSASHPFFKTRMCHAWQQSNGECQRGTKCLYAHGAQELRTRPNVPMIGPMQMQMMKQMPMMMNALRSFCPPAQFNQFMQTMQKFGLMQQQAPPQQVAPKEEAKPPVMEFVVDKAEEKKRADRAKRFAAGATYKASFEEEEAREKEEAKEREKAKAKAKEEAAKGKKQEEEQAAMSAAMSLDLPGLPNFPPNLPDSQDGTDQQLEDQVADYLLMMEQQFLEQYESNAGGDEGDMLGDIAEAFDVPESITGSSMGEVETAAGEEPGGSGQK
eukprot:gnl/MRDRNA2_/MRDRNA2_30944_c0_seq1.p1 gnl/MRDRNA2_/MRDRNA2_30944_c0~~gnl/MRDRNA2_/MRDRNA2_30944_c0_seq1.p1  ORF type:complete len:674 (+),score=167.89 gnl/MRDRNA2_/MRDRNA2_30944_c0_seq1:84-2105(+)